MKTILLCAFLLLYYALHQDFWNWSATRPLWFGFMPPGLVYHAVYALLSAAFMAVLVRIAWPRKLEIWADEDTPE